jgi:peptidoglycan-associated lipoprotein
MEICMRMRKVLLFVLTNISVLVFMIGCKKFDIKRESRVNVDTADNISYVDNEPSLRGKSVKANINLKNVYFGFDRSDLTEASMKILKENIVYLTNNPSIKIVLEGHTDNRGTSEYNLSLGQRRAIKVKEYCTKLGISSNRIATVSYGKEKPAEIGDNESAWSKNRRVEVKTLN